jgi:hypothetical protein
MLVTLALLACSVPTSDAVAAPIEPTVVECPAGSNVNLYASGAVWSAEINTGTALVSPLLQIQQDRVVVFCGEYGGTLTVDWSE